MISSKVNKSQIQAVLPDDNGHCYQYFNLSNEFQAIFTGENSNHVDIFVNDRYFICHKKFIEKKIFIISTANAIYEIPNNACQFLKNNLLSNHQLLSGSIKMLNILNKMGDANGERYATFKNTILDLQLTWSNRFMKIVHEYLKNRHSAHGFLIHQNGVQLMLAEAAAHLKSAALLRKNVTSSFIDDLSAYQLTIAQEIKKANHLLARLSGGRAFLSGNILEMILVFEYFQDIYFA